MSSTPAPSKNTLQNLIDGVMHGRAERYAAAVKRFQSQKPKLDQAGQAFEKKQISYLKSMGLKSDVLNQDLAQDAKALQTELAEIRPPLLSRPAPAAPDPSKIKSLFTQVPTVTVAPVYGVFAPPTPPVNNGITQGWIFSSDPNLKIQLTDTGSGTGWWAVAYPPPTPYDLTFTFTPANTATYDLLAVLVFHGFYIVRADDGYLTSKSACVGVNVQMNANQYTETADFTWKTFPKPLDIGGGHINEFNDFDQTLFFDYSAPLRGGDPVLVTVRITLDCVARGSGSYAEINFADGVANYIQPLLLSVTSG